MKIKLTNQFHSASILVNAVAIPTSTLMYISARDIKMAKNVLCGIDGCTCSNVAGQNYCDIKLSFFPDGSAVVLPTDLGY